jgi:hypothetical protein
MEAYFPGTVEVRYYDALSPDVRAAHEERMRGFEECHWPYPVSLVAGEVISVGTLSVYALVQAVERVREKPADPPPGE